MIYCVEDDAGIRELVVYTLQVTGFEARGFADGGSFWRAMDAAPPELVLLDIMLPDTDGIEILKRLRRTASTRALPVILLTARGTEYDKVLGLDSGADDYIAKPFGMMELVSRIRAVLRRTPQPGATGSLRVDDIVLNAESHQVWVQGRAVALTFKEFALLELLMENEGIVLTRDRILEQIWGYTFDGETRTVDVHIRTLRQKLGEGGAVIQTIRGVGYRIGGAA